VKYLAKIHDIGKNWKVTELMEVNDDFFIDKDKYLVINKEEYDSMVVLNQSNELYYPKDLEKFSVSEIITEEIDTLSYAKYKVKNKITNSFKGGFSNVDLFNFLRFVSLTSELSDKGYYFYKENLDQKIEEIGKLNNQKLLEKAKDLAEVITELEPHMSSFNKLIRVKKEIDKCSSEDQIRDLISKEF